VSDAEDEDEVEQEPHLTYDEALAKAIEETGAKATNDDALQQCHVEVDGSLAATGSHDGGKSESASSELIATSPPLKKGKVMLRITKQQMLIVKTIRTPPKSSIPRELEQEFERFCQLKLLASCGARASRASICHQNGLT
jgi:hypothetical protein